MTWNKKRIAVAATAFAVVIAGAGTAFAYWTAGGSGTGTATTGTTQTLVVNQTSTLTAMYPGDTAQALSGNFDNPNPGPIHATAVTATVTGVDKVGCTASDYTVAGTGVVTGSSVPTGSGVGAWTGLTVQFNNTTANQDPCKGATVTLTYAVS